MLVVGLHYGSKLKILAYRSFFMSYQHYHCSRLDELLRLDSNHIFTLAINDM